MWTRVWRVTRRATLLVLLVLTVLGLFLLPRPPPLTLPPRLPSLLAPIEPPNELQDEDVLVQDADDVSKRYWFMQGGEKPADNTDPFSPLFPEDAPGDDRIVQQLLYKLPDGEVPPLKTILLANGPSGWGGLRMGRAEFNKCPVNRCKLSAEARHAATADAILFKDYYNSLKVRRPPKQIWILYYLECPFHTSSLRSVPLDAFNWTATYRRDSEIVAPYERWVYHDPLITERDQHINYAANKTKKVAWFVSNCNARNTRLEYACQLAEEMPVDIYGACGHRCLHANVDRCPRGDRYCFDMLSRDYKFYLAFENSNCRDYITEKFFVNGLQRDVVPIVMGASTSEYAAVAPRGSYIHVDDFESAAHLAKYLKDLDADDHAYNSYFRWKGTGEFINTHFFCRVCAMLHANERRKRVKNYRDVQAWWRNNTCSIPTRR